MTALGAGVPVWVRTAIGAQATLLVGMGLGRFSYSPMVPALIQSGSLTPAEAGYVGAANLGGYLVGGLAVPWLLHRADAFAILRSCLILSFIALCASALPAGFLWLIACRGLLGITVAVMMILAIATVTANAPPGRLGQAAGIAFTGVGLGIFISAAGLPFLLDRGLVWAWIGAAVIGAVGLVLGLWGWSARLDATRPVSVGAKTPSAPRSRRMNPDAIRLVIAQGLFSVGLVPHSIYWVDYLVRDLNWSMAEGSMQWTLFGIGAVVGTVAWGRLADRIGFSHALAAVFASLALGIALPLIAPSPATVIFSSLVVGAQPGLSAVIAGRAQQAMGSGSMLGLWRWMVLSVGTGQMVGGYGLVALFNGRGSYLEVFLIGSAAMLGGGVLALGLGRDRPPSSR
ncbi:YbfB/YjiJ family MFS transporter [Thalassobaculum sp.]|uniref:YbfB/YjiJ family MFS transporter n=1 Tax=Thalassobaculum sp. TaxID=2022740 RepID=UPI0032EBFE6E